MQTCVFRTGAILLAAGAAVGVATTARGGTPVDAVWQTQPSGFWNNPANWDIGIVPNNDLPNPGDEYNAFLSDVLGAAYTVTLDVPVTVNDLTMDAPGANAVLTIDAFNFNVNGNLNVSQGNMIFGGGVGTFTTAVGSTTTFANALIDEVQFLAQGGVFFAGTGDQMCDTDFEHEDDCTWEAAAGDITLVGATSFTTAPGATFRILNNSSMLGMAGTPSVLNEGTIDRSTATGAATFDGVTLTNAATGVIQVNTGTLAVSGATGTLDNAGLIEIMTGNTLEVAGGATLANFSAGSLTGGVYDLQGTLRFDTGGAGIDTIAADITLDGAGSAIQNSDNSDALATTDTIDATGALTLLGGRDLTTGGDFDNDGAIEVNDDSTFEVPSGAALNGFDGAGTRTLTGGTFTLIDDPGVAGAATLTFDAGPLGVDTIDTTVILDGVGATIVNSDTSTDALTPADTIGNDGALELLSGKSMTTAGSFTVESTGRLEVDAGSLFEVPNAGGNALTNFVSGTLQDGEFEIRGEIRAPNLAVNVIGGVNMDMTPRPVDVVLDGTESLFTNNVTNTDAFAVLNTIELGSSLTLRNGRSLTVMNDLTVRGMLRIEGSSGLRGSQPGVMSTFVVEGDFTQEDGVLALGGGLLEVSGVYDLRRGATVSGFGTITAGASEAFARGDNFGFVNDGVVAPAGLGMDSTGLLVIDSTYVQRDGALIKLDIGGYDAGIDYDVLRIIGESVFEGGPGGMPEIEVSLKGPFLPVAMSIFDVLILDSTDADDLPSVNLIEGSPLFAEAYWTPGSDNAWILRVTFNVPAPGSAVFGGMILAMSCGRRRPRA